jgi:hypothetical protein
MKKKPLSIIIISIVGIFLIVGVFAVLGTTKSQYSLSSYDSRSSIGNVDSIGDMGFYEGYYKEMPLYLRMRWLIIRRAQRYKRMGVYLC